MNGLEVHIAALALLATAMVFAGNMDHLESELDNALYVGTFASKQQLALKSAAGLCMIFR